MSPAGWSPPPRLGTNGSPSSSLTWKRPSRSTPPPAAFGNGRIKHSTVWPAGACRCLLPDQRAAAIMSHDLRGRAGRHHDCRPGRAVQMRCLECGVETAEATPACVVCGAPAPRQPAASAWSGSRAWVKRYSVHQRRFWVKRDQAAGANALAGPGGTGDSTADPPDSDAAGWAVPAAIRASVGQQPSESAPDSEVDGAILAEWVEARKFSTTRLRPGYDEEEVDAFADAIRDTFLGIREPSLTPDEIRNKQFSTTRLRPGYDEEEVDAFLDRGRIEAGSSGSARASPPSSGPWRARPGGRPAGWAQWPLSALITVGIATALVVMGGLIAGLTYSFEVLDVLQPLDGPDDISAPDRGLPPGLGPSKLQPMERPFHRSPLQSAAHSRGVLRGQCLAAVTGISRGSSGL